MSFLEFNLRGGRLHTILLFLLLLSPTSFSMTVMSYNVENLFDTVDDPLTDDEQFLPKGHASKKACQKNKSSYRKNQCLRFNWDEAQLKKKLKRLAKVINSYEGTIDVLGLIEVENEYVVNELNKRLAKPFNRVVVAPSSDSRGIRVATLLRTDKNFKFSSFREWKVKVGKRKTRTILQTNMKWKGSDYCFFVNHWPSQGSRTPARIKAAKVLKKAMEKSNCKVVAMGDFNTLDHESPNPFSLLASAGLKDLTSKLREKKDVLGSYFFGPRLAWNYLDRFLVSKSVFKKVKKKDLNIFITKTNSGVWEQKRRDSPYYGTRVVGTPKRFKAGGVSDHFPIVVNLAVD
jgi:predicted extracellular nuclease